MSIDLILVGVSLFTWGIGESMFFFFQPIYLEQLGATPLLIGTIFSLFGLVMLFTHIPAGYLADRIGRRPLMIAAWLAGVIATCVMALARSLPLFVVGMLFYGLTAFVSSPLFSYVTAARGRMSAGRAMTLTSAMYNLGAVIGPITGGLIGEQMTLRTVYWVAAGIFIVSSVLLFFIRPQSRDHHDINSPPTGLLSNRGYLSFLGISFLAVFSMYLSQTLTPNFLLNERGVSLIWLGRLGSIGCLGNALLNLAFGQLNARLGFILSQVSVGLFAGLLWQGGGLFWYGLGYFLLGGYRSARMLAFAQVRSLIHQSQMGLAYGFAETVNSLAIILAPLLAGYLYEGNPVVIYPVSLGFLLISILVSVFLSPREASRRVSTTSSTS